MKRRLTLAIVGTAAAAVVLAGLGTLVLARFSARQVTEDELRQQAEAIAAVLAPPGGTPGIRRLPVRDQLDVVRRRLEARDVQVVAVQPDGTVTGDLPATLSTDDLVPVDLREGLTVSGTVGNLVFAAAPIPARVRPAALGGSGRFGSAADIVPAVLVTRAPDSVLGPAAGWFVLAAGATLAIAAVVAWRVGRRLTEPLVHATEATGRIAAGDLQTRVPEPPGASDELTALAHSINSMAATLERSRGLERQFLMSVSHDLRTPLTSIRGYAEAISDGTAEPLAAAAVISSESRRLERLVGDLLDLAKLDADRFRLDLQPVDVAAVVADTVEGFRPEADAAAIELRLVATEPATIAADPDRLAQVVANLAENALRYAVRAITFDVVSADGSVEITVRDDGEGIDPEDLPHVFERLYVAKSTPRRKEAGSGLGLAIVHELVGAMGGTVEARRSMPAGTAIVVRLPHHTA